MTRRGLTLALAMSLCAATGAGVAHADGCTPEAGGTYKIDGVTGSVPKVRMGNSLTIDNRMHLDAPDQSSSAFETMVIPVRQQGGYTPGRPPTVSLSVDGGPSHRFSFTWRPATRPGDLGTWVSTRVEFGRLTRGVHVLHETLSMPVGSPDGLYELGAYAYMDGPCGMVRGTTMGSVSYEFTGGTPAREPSRATGGGATGTPSPRVSTSRTPGAAGTPGSPSQAPSGSPSPSAPSSPSVSAPPSPGGSPMSSPSPTPPVAASPAVVPLATTPAANGSSALPWVIGLLAALAAAAVGGVLALRRRPR